LPGERSPERTEAVQRRVRDVVNRRSRNRDRRSQVSAYAAAGQTPGDPEALDPQHAARGGSAADPNSPVLAAGQEPLDPARDGHAGYVRDPVELRRVVRADPIAPGAQAAAASAVGLPGAEHERGERVLEDVEQRQLRRRERPSPIAA
jgi:hypothetical protein